MILQFRTYGNVKQEEAIREWLNPSVFEILYGGAKASGKSYLGVSLIFGDALTYPGTHYFIARKNVLDLLKFTIPSIMEVFGHWGLTEDYYHWDGKLNAFKLYNGSMVFLLHAKDIPGDPDFHRFGSMQMTRGWIEEAGEFVAKAKDNLAASVGRKLNEKYGLPGKVLMTCNPTTNWLYTDFYKPHLDGTLEAHRRFIQALPSDNKRLDAGYYETLLRSLKGADRERLIYGNWEYDSDPRNLVDIDAIMDMFTNEYVQGGKQGISSDLAMKGRDRFIVIHWDGMRASLEVDKLKADGKEIEEDIRTVILNKQVPRSRVVYDSDGLGNYLSGYLSGTVEFRGGASPIKTGKRVAVDRNGNRIDESEQYQSLKAQCAYKLAEKINNREIWVQCTPEQRERIKAELLVCLKAAHLNPDLKRDIIKKDKMKELLNRSPDYLDALLMGMYLELRKPKTGMNI